MSVNNQAQDRYGGPGIRSVDFELVEFRDLEVDDLFHLRNDDADGNRNHCHRKLNETDSMDLITRQIVQVGKIKVYQKD